MNNKLLKAVLANIMALCMLVAFIPQGDDYGIEVCDDTIEYEFLNITINDEL